MTIEAPLPFARKESFNPDGRPSSYNEVMAETICSLMEQGMSVAKICQLETMPDEGTIYNWLSKHSSFFKRYNEAQTIRAERLMNELIEISDQPASEWARTTGDPTGAQHRKLQLDARKWAIARLSPKKYGDKLQTEHTGELKIDTIKKVIVDPTEKASG